MPDYDRVNKFSPGSLYFSRLEKFFLKAKWVITPLWFGTYINQTRFTHPQYEHVFFEVFYFEGKNEQWVCSICDSMENFYNIVDIQKKLADQKNFNKLLIDLLNKTLTAGLTEATGTGG